MSPLFIALTVALHAGSMSLVSPTWKTVQVPPDLAEFYADHLAQALRREGFKVVTASELTALLSLERQKQLLGCAEDAAACVAELGAAMGCDGVLLVNLAKLEDLYRGNLKIVGTQQNNIVSEVSVEATGQKALLRELDEGAKRLAGGIPHAARPEVTAVTAVSSGVRQYWWIPAAVGVVGGAVGTVGFVSSSEQHRLLKTELAESGVTSEAYAVANRGKAMQTMGWVGMGVAAAGIVGLGAILLFGKESPVAVAVGPAGATLTLKANLK